MINMIHEIQTMRMLIGEIVSVSGFLSSKNRNFEVEDTGGFSICLIMVLSARFI